NLRKSASDMKPDGGTGGNTLPGASGTKAVLTAVEPPGLKEANPVLREKKTNFRSRVHFMEHRGHRRSGVPPSLGYAFVTVELSELTAGVADTIQFPSGETMGGSRAGSGISLRVWPDSRLRA